MPTHVAANFCEKWGSDFSINGLTAADGSTAADASTDVAGADPTDLEPAAVVSADQPPAKGDQAPPAAVSWPSGPDQ